MGAGAIDTAGPASLSFEDRYRVIQSRDPRFDGQFVTAVRSTGIYCRPSCPARTPKRENVRFFPTAAAAQAGGFRACKRCRPDATPGSPEWDARADVVGRAMRMIAEEGRGVVVLFRDIEPRQPRQDEVSSHVLRQYGLGAQILSVLGLSDLILLTNSAPVRVIGLDAYGLSIHSTRPIKE